MNGHTVPHGPHGRIGAEMPPPDRTMHEHLVRAVLTWSDPAALQPGDYEQVGLLLTGAAYAVAADVREHAARLPGDDGRRLLAEIVLDEADARLSQRSRTLHAVQNKASVLRALYERLERLHTSAPAAKATATPNRPPDTRSAAFPAPPGTRGPMPLLR
ncbi:restriction endonuclease [Streptomyces sp. NPDC127119]|uniref:restriction endonuclease n=1 Tax=Streptomyces sp. NPDC127119 TaxID=3345370 RepID=UPI00362A4B90